MSSILLVSSKNDSKQFLQRYLEKNNIAHFEVEYVDGMKVEDARRIKKALAFKTKNKKLYYFSGELTIEAQNALLKSIEEHANNVHFIFCAEKEEQLLPTIRSRCSVIRLIGKSFPDESIMALIDEFYSQAVPSWSVIETLITTVSAQGIDSMLLAVRLHMLNNIDNRDVYVRCYVSCKKILQLLPLIQRNNVSSRTVVENSLLLEAPYL